MYYADLLALTLDELLADCSSPEEILGKNGLLKQLTKGLVERDVCQRSCRVQ